MAIIYVLTTYNPLNNPVKGEGFNPISAWPPQLKESDWVKKQSKNFMQVKNDPDRSYRIFYFKNEEEYESYMNANRLDSESLAILKEWHSAYNITWTEQWIEVPDYTPKIPGLFG